MEEFHFCGAASRVDEWIIIILAYQVISDQRANVFNFILPAWVRVLILSMANNVNASSHQQILETRTSHVTVKKDLLLKVNTVTGHEMDHQAQA